jgi:hypothetical protein
MIEIFDDSGELLHIVFRKNDFKNRTDIVPSNNFLQCAAIKLEKFKTFKPHMHLWKSCPNENIAQESWVVVEGSVKCHFYDRNKLLLCEHILIKGDLSITLQGGHTYTILEDNTLVYEFKTGPYEGQSKDKVFI